MDYTTIIFRRYCYLEISVSLDVTIGNGLYDSIWIQVNGKIYDCKDEINAEKIVHYRLVLGCAEGVCLRCDDARRWCGRIRV